MVIKIAHIADCHLRQTQYGSRARGYDFYKGLLSAVTTAIREMKVDAILCAGDLIDSPYPSAEIISEQLMTIHETLQEHKIPMLVINGNHDNTRTPWSKVFCPGPPNRYTSGIIAIDGDRYTLVKDDLRVNVLGLPYCPPDELRTQFERMKEMNVTADILMWHGEVLEFCGYPREGCITMDDFPSGMFQLVAMGDQHVHKYLERSDGLAVAYPGSTELCSLSEDEHKKMFVYTFSKNPETGKAELEDVDDLPFKTRRIQKYTILSQEDLEHAISTMAPGALVFVEYSGDVSGVMPRLTGFVDMHPNTILRPTMLRTDKEEVTAEVDDYREVQSLHQYTASVLEHGQITGPLANLVCQLTNPVVDSKSVIDQYVDTTLN